MAFTNLGAAGSAIPKTAGATATLTPTRTLAVGEFAVLYIGWDSDGGTTGITITLSVSDTGGNTWTRSAERLVRPSSLNGVKGAIFTSVLTTQLTTASTITVTETSAVPVAKALGLRTFSVGAGYAPQIAVSTGGSSPPQSAGLAASTGSNIRCPSGADELVTAAAGRLWLALHAAETTVTTGTADADYTSVEIKTTGGSDLSNIRIRAAYRLYTGTNDTYSYSTGATSTDHVAILTVYDEISAGPFDQTVTMSGIASAEDDGRLTVVPADRAWAGYLTGGSHVTTSTTYVSNPISPYPNSVVMLWVVDTGTVPASLLTVTGCNLTWASVQNQTLATNESARLWFGYGASPTPGTVTLTFSANRTHVGITATQVTGVLVGADHPWDAIWDSFGGASTGSITVDFSPLASRPPNVACVAGYWIRDTGVTTIESGWDLVGFSQTDVAHVYAAWSPGLTDDTLTFSTAASSATSFHLGYVWLAAGGIAFYSSIASGFAAGTATVTVGAAPGGDTVSPSGIATAFASGTATVTPGGVTVTTSGIASGYAAGTATVLRGAVSVAPSGIASGAAFGTATLTRGPVTVTTSGLASGFAAGTATLLRGAVTVTTTGIPSGYAAGTPTVARGAVTVTPGGIASGFAAGTATLLRGGVTTSPSGIATSFVAGTAVVSLAGTQTIAPSGLASGFAAGTATLLRGAVTVAPGGIASGFAAGTPTVVRAQAIALAGVASAFAAGTPTVLRGAVTLQPGGVASAFVSGSHVVAGAGVQIVAPNGVASGFATGTQTVTPGGVTVSVPGVASGFAAGTHVVAAAGPKTIAPSGIASGFAAGTHTLLRGGVTVTPGGIASGFASGTAVVTVSAQIQPGGIASAFVAGTATLTTGAVAITVPSIASGFASGTASVFTGLVIVPTGIASGFVAGLHTVITVPPPIPVLPVLPPLPEAVHGRFRTSLRVSGIYRP